MTTFKWILFRTVLLLAGWFPPTGMWIHRLLVSVYVKRSKKPYGASGRFFTPEDLKAK